MKSVFLSALCAIAACGGAGSSAGKLPDAPPADAAAPDAAAAQYAGDVTGSSVPAEGTVFVVWVVVSGSPDYIYKFGDGTSTGGRYAASLPGPLPADAINADGLAAGFLALVPKGTSVPQGKLDQNTIEPLILGASHNGIVFRTKDSQRTGWATAFPAGELSCGRCIVATAGGNDTMEPAPCSELTISTTNGQACNVF